MLCGVCRRQVPRGAAYCTTCGAAVRRAAPTPKAPLEVVLGDGSRVPLGDTVTIGRAADNTIRLPDPSVSRHHARIVANGDAPRIEDAGSSSGTYLNGKKIAGSVRLGEGTQIRLGNVDLRVERGSGAAPVVAFPLELVLSDGSRVPLADVITIGRAPDNTIQLPDPSISRHHARILPIGELPKIEDAGSSTGTYVNGRKVAGRVGLGDGTKVRIGDITLPIERRRDEADAARTIVVRPGASIVMPIVGRAEVEHATTYGFKPKLRSGWALKRLPASEGDRRFVLRDLRGGGFVRMGADEAALFELLDGSHSLVELMSEAERRVGARGAGTVASLLADLGEKGFLQGVEQSGEGAGKGSLLKRLFTPRDFSVGWAGPMFERIYRAGGWLLFTRAAVAIIAAVAVSGICTWIYLVAGRYGTPFVVASKVGLGGLVFLIGRFVMVAFHELGHGLTVCSFGRRVQRAGLKLMLVFPYAFVDTSEAWFEPRRRRLAISAAGPVSDFFIGGTFSLAALVSGHTVRDIFFNLALSAYVGGVFNLNPFLERDGYHMLVDLLREPGLRRRSRAWLSGRLLGSPAPAGESPFFKPYAVLSVFWLFSGLIFAIIGSKRFYPKLVHLAPREVVWAAFALVYIFALLPVVLTLGRPLLLRWRTRQPGGAEGVAEA